MKPQYVSWESLRALRQYWIAQGHKDVPHPDCSCGYEGPNKPESCAYKVGHQAN